MDTLFSCQNMTMSSRLEQFSEEKTSSREDYCLIYFDMDAIGINLKIKNVRICR